MFIFQEGHKWLNSCHKVNDLKKPAIMAWETVSTCFQLINRICQIENKLEIKRNRCHGCGQKILHSMV